MTFADAVAAASPKQGCIRRPAWDVNTRVVFNEDGTYELRSATAATPWTPGTDDAAATDWVVI